MKTAMCAVLAVVGSVGAVGGAGAMVTQTVRGNVAARDTDFASLLTVPGFDPSQGTLTAVAITLTGTFEGVGEYENLSGDAVSEVRLVLEVEFELELNGQQIASVTPTADSGERAVSAFDGDRDFAGPSAVRFEADASGASTSTFLVADGGAAAQIANGFVGTGDVSLFLLADGALIVDADGSTFDRASGIAAGAEVEVIYTFVPAPAGVAAGLTAGLLAIRRRR